MAEQEKEKAKKKKVKNPFVELSPEWPDPNKPKYMGEALSIAGRRKLAQNMIRLVRKLSMARQRARSRFASDKNLKVRAQRLARSIVRKRVAGKRGEDYKSLSPSDKIAIDKMVEKGKGKATISKLVKVLSPGVKRAEADRLRGELVGHRDTKKDERHKRKLHGRKA